MPDHFVGCDDNGKDEPKSPPGLVDDISRIDKGDTARDTVGGNEDGLGRKKLDCDDVTLLVRAGDENAAAARGGARRSQPAVAIPGLIDIGLNGLL
mmetsp:Transcript_3787/g.8364  ORF Transcript_3787/g.8364 Transcript_3787/m.8364 type:complete len:96 (+) Transcript_3787:494-781(+)